MKSVNANIVREWYIFLGNLFMRKLTKASSVTRIFSISDLHLSFSKFKPMDKFGDHWINHPNKIRDNWIDVVYPNDIVLVPGDISWASKLSDALADLFFIEGLPGKKVLVKGNHDFWWQGKKQLEDVIKDTSLFAIRNNCVVLPIEDTDMSIGFIGTRGFDFERVGNMENDDIYSSKYFLREMNRLQLSLADAKKQKPDRLVALIHHPPFRNVWGGRTPITHLLSNAGVTDCVYGHLHYPEKHKKAYKKELDGVKYHLVSADYLDFLPKLLFWM
jgi:uncharacterized protein